MTVPMLDWDHIEETIQSIIRSENIPEIIKKINQQNDLSPIWNGLFNKIEGLEQTPQKLTPQERSLWKLIAILYYVEGPLSLIINYIIYSLMLKGNKIWIRYEKRNADSFDDLYNISLHEKLDFLNTSKFDFISKICQNVIRNAVAHQDLKIETDGTVIILNRNKKVKTVKIKDFDRIWEDIKQFIEIFRNTLKRS